MRMSVMDAPAIEAPVLAKAVSNAFLQLGRQDNIPISPLKLQKLVYFAHGWHLGLKNESLIGEPVLAWPYGPVVEDIYHEFKVFKDAPITRFAVLRDPGGDRFEPFVPSDDQFKNAVIGRVWQLYRDSTASELSTITHRRGSPWAQVTRDGHVQSRDLIIPNPLIVKYFASKAKHAQT